MNGRLLLALTSLALVAAPQAARANGGSLTVQTAVAAPIAASNAGCTAEPRSIIYGTANYDSSRALTYVSEGIPGPGYYLAANAPSSLDLVPALLAGARSDLCLGFTLPPDLEESAIRTYDNQFADRLQDPVTPWDDTAAAHVAPANTGDPAPAGDDPQRVQLDLPAGEGLDLADQTTCAAGQFGASSYLMPTCPAGSQIGDALLRLSVWLGGPATRHLPLPGAKAYLLEHGPDEVARIGVAARPLSTLAPVKLTFRVTLLPSGRLRAIADALPRNLYASSAVQSDGSLASSATAKPTYLESVALRLWGAKADHPTLATDLAATTTDCSAPATGAASVQTYGGTSSALDATGLAAAGCSSLDYAPTASLTLDDPRPAVPTGATVALELGAGATVAGRLPVRTSSASVELPSGMRLGEQIGSASAGRTACTAAEFAATASTPSACPAASTVGSATIATDLATAPLTGTIALGQPTVDGDLAALYVDASLPGATAADAPRLKLTGRLIATGGDLALRFDALPALPLGTLSLALSGGAGALLTAPATCGDATATASFSGANARTATATTAATTIAGDCATGSPTLTVRATADRPGGRDGLAVTVARAATGAPLSAITARLPEGVALDPRAIATCNADAAAAGACPDAASLGAVRLTLGAGDAPAAVDAALFRVPATGGELARGVAVAHLRLAGLDLGTVVVPVTFGYDAVARRLGMTAVVPTTAGNLPLDVRALSVQFVAGAAVTPTACGPLAATADTTDASGSGAHTEGALALDGCGGLGLAPTISASTTGDTTGGGHPTVALTIQGRAGDTNLDAVQLTFPAGLELDPAHATCELAAFNAGTCGAAGRIGGASATSALADADLAGELHLVRTGGALPALGLTVGGTYGFRALADLTVDSGRLVARFTSLPDLPVSRLSLALDGGTGGALRSTATGCTNTAEWRAAFRGKGGQSATAATTTPCPSGGKAPTVELTVKAKTGLKLKLSGFAGLRLQAAKLTLSPRMKFNAAAARKPKNTAIAVIGPKAKTTFSSTSLTVAIPAGKSAAQEVAVRVRWPAIAVSPRGHRSTTFRLRLAFTDGSVQVRDVLVTLPAKLPGAVAKPSAPASKR